MAKPTTSGLGPKTLLVDAAGRLLGLQLADLRRHEKAADQLDPDAIHDLRVGIRRLRASLGMLDRDGVLAWAEREAKRLQDALGDVRDIQVQLEWLGEKSASQGEHTLDRPRALLERRLPSRQRRLHRALLRWHRERPRIVEESKAIAPTGKLGGGALRQDVRRRLRQLDRRFDEMLAAEVDMPTAHRARLAVKRLRYDAEVIQPALGTAIEGLLDAVTPLQKAFGALHDADVRLILLEEAMLRVSAAASEGLEELIEKERDLRDELAAEAASRARAWRSRKLGRRFRRLLA